MRSNTNRPKALLVLEDGTVFKGTSIGYQGNSVGEVVFNTAMTGYQEILSDPSYAKQIVTLTYPHIGNTGVNAADNEADHLHVAGLVIKDLPRLASNWRQEQSLDEYLNVNQVAAIAEIDTRRLTRLLREKGAQRGVIIADGVTEASGAAALINEFAGLSGLDLAKEVTTSTPYTWGEGSWQLDPQEVMHLTPESALYHVVAYDYGVKKNILRMLVDRGCYVTVVPAQTPAQTVLDMKPDGVFLSNGPGDPEPCDYAIQAIQQIVEQELPTFGICLGHQLLSLASGASTSKMKFGHHGANHPVQELSSKQVMISSQNHGFAVQEDGLPSQLQVTHRSLFDGTVQGVSRTDVPAFGFQGHPEASPGPHDVAPVFDQFIAMMEAAK